MSTFTLVHHRPRAADPPCMKIANSFDPSAEANPIFSLEPERGMGHLNRINQPLTRFGIHRLVTNYARTGEQDCTVAGDETREPAHNPAHERCPSVVRRRRHQHDPRLARSRVSGHDTYLCRGRHGNEGESAGPGRYLRPANQATAANATVADDVPEIPIVAAPLKNMLRVKPGKPTLSLACAT